MIDQRQPTLLFFVQRQAILGRELRIVM